MTRLIQFVVGLLTGKSGSIILGASAAVVSAMVAYAGWQSWRVHALRADLAEEMVAHAECEAQKAAAVATADRLADAVEKQNRQIAELRQRAEAAAAADALRAARVLRAGDQRREAIENSEGAGPEVMNTWLHSRIMR